MLVLLVVAVLLALGFMCGLCRAAAMGDADMDRWLIEERERRRA